MRTGDIDGHSGGSAPEPGDSDRAGPAPKVGDLQRLGDFLGSPNSGLDQGPVADWPLERRVTEVWARAVGPEVAEHATPASLRRGRLTVATSSSVWAQTLQLMSESLVKRLNDALGQVVVTTVICRPAGWDPAGGAEGPRALRGGWFEGSEVAGSAAAAPGRVTAGLPDFPLTAEEEAAVAAVGRAEMDQELRALISRVMRGFFLRAHEREAAVNPPRRRR